MAAFVTFVRAYAAWIYLLLTLGVLFGIKMLVDAQRLARTTLFSLDQERATEETYRALVLIGVCIVAFLVVTGLVVFIAPLAPPQESPILRGPTATLPALVFPTSTPIPSATATALPPTETPFVTSVPITATATHAAVKPTGPPVLPTLPPSAYPLPAPVIIGPLPNGGTWTGEGQANAALTFRWKCEQCVLGSNDWYEVVISYTDRAGVPRTRAGRTQETFLPLRRIYEGGGFEMYQQAKEDVFQWYLQVKREPGNQPISPPSETWKFVWH